MPMDKRERKLAFLGFVTVFLLAAIPTWLFLTYGKRILPISNFKSMELSQPLPQLPFSTIVSPNNNIATRKAEKTLSEEQKIGIVTGLAMVFHVRADNLAHYFPYFTMIQFGSGENIHAFAIVFSSNLPQVSASANARMVKWSGRYIAFDLTRRQMIYVVDGLFHFDGSDALEVSVHNSAFFLELGAVGPPVDPRRIVPGEKF